MGSEPAGTQTTRSMRYKERPTHHFHARLRRSVRPIGHLRATRAIHQDPTPLAGVGESDLWLTRGPAAHLPNLPRNDARSTQPGWTRKREGVRVKGPRPWGRTSRFVRPLRVHPQQPLPWAAHNVHKHALRRARVGFPNRAFTHPSRGAGRGWGAVFRGCRFARPPAHFCDPDRDRRP
jgi:hypothetical protein